MGVYRHPALCSSLALQMLTSGLLPSVGAAPQVQTTTTRVFDTRWIWHQCGDDAALQETQLFCQVCWELPVLGHCQDIVFASVSCPWLLSCFEKSKYVGAVVHSAATADLLTRGCCNRMQHLVVATYVTALASATGQGLRMGTCPCSCQWVLQGIHLSTGEEVCQASLPCPYQTGDVVWLCLPNVHPGPLLPQTSCCT